MFYTIQAVFDQSDLEKRIDKMYPRGLSKHGIEYLVETCLIYPHPGSGPPTDFTPISPVIEAIFEQVRRADFPHLPSRMQSMFAWCNLEDAYMLRDNAKNNSAIYQIESESAFVGDMNLVYLSASVIGAFELATRYWSGRKTRNPLLEAVIPLPVVVGDEVKPTEI